MQFGHARTVPARQVQLTGGGWGGGFHHHGFGPAFGVTFVGGGYADEGCYVTRRVRTPYGYRLRTFNVCY